MELKLKEALMKKDDKKKKKDAKKMPYKKC